MMIDVWWLTIDGDMTDDDRWWYMILDDNRCW